MTFRQLRDRGRFHDINRVFRAPAGVPFPKFSEIFRFLTPLFSATPGPAWSYRNFAAFHRKFHEIRRENVPRGTSHARKPQAPRSGRSPMFHVEHFTPSTPF